MVEQDEHTNKYELQVEMNALKGEDNRTATGSTMGTVKVDLSTEATCELRPKGRRGAKGSISRGEGPASAKALRREEASQG